MTIKLEVGKRYVDRNGDVHGPLVEFSDPAFPFSYGVNSWTEGGFSIAWDLEFALDLVAEYVELKETEGLKLEVGKKYVARNGEVHEIVNTCDHPIYKFTSDRRAWSDDGFFLTSKEMHHNDLVAEYVEPVCSELPSPIQSPEVDAIQAERKARYGSWVGNAELTDKFLGVAQSGATWRQMTASQRSAIVMTLHKIGRMCNGDPNYQDNWVDAISYLDLALKEIRKEAK